MTPAEFLTEAERRLSGASYTVERRALRGGPAVVGQRKPFRPQWFLTQLKTSVVVAAVETVTFAGWQAFAAESFDVAKSIKGGLPTGFQSGVAAVPVLAGVNVDPAAMAHAAQRPHHEWFKGFVLPALVDLSTGAVAQYDGRIVVGAVYAPFLRKQRAIVTTIVRP